MFILRQTYKVFTHVKDDNIHARLCS